MSKTKTRRLKEEIAELERQLIAHQAKCKHPERHRIYELRGSSGNYDPSMDDSWTKYKCLLCEKVWHKNYQTNLVGTRVNNPWNKKSEKVDF